MDENDKPVVSKPVLEIGSQRYTAAMPKVKAWHDFIAFEVGTDDIPAEDYLNRMADLLAGLFPRVTADMIIDNMPLDEIRPKFKECERWLTWLINSKLQKLPKNE